MVNPILIPGLHLSGLLWFFNRAPGNATSPIRVRSTRTSVAPYVLIHCDPAYHPRHEDQGCLLTGRYQCFCCFTVSTYIEMGIFAPFSISASYFLAKDW